MPFQTAPKPRKRDLHVAQMRARRAYRAQPFRFAAIYASHMVLQAAPQKARVHGFAPPGTEVAVGLRRGGPSAPTAPRFLSVTTASAGPEGVWSVTLPPVGAGGPYALTASATALAPPPALDRESLQGEGGTPLPPNTSALTLPQRHSHTPTPAPTAFPTASNRPPTAFTSPVTALQPLWNLADRPPPLQAKPWPWRMCCLGPCGCVVGSPTWCIRCMRCSAPCASRPWQMGIPKSGCSQCTLWPTRHARCGSKEGSLPAVASRCLYGYRYGCCRALDAQL